MSGVINYKFTTLSEPEINPFCEEIKKSNRNWIKRFNILDLSNEKINMKMERMNFATFVAMSYPRAEQSHLELFADYIFWLFAFDDVFENVELKLAEYMRKQALSILNDKGFEKSKSQHINNLLVAWQDIIDRLKLCMNSNCWERFMQHTTDSMNDALKVIIYRKEKIEISSEEYMILRRNENGSLGCFDLIEIMENSPNEIFADKRLQRLIEIACNNVAWVNDIYSSFKDHEEGLFNSLISIIEQEKGINKENAMNYIYNCTEEEIHEFSDIYEQIKTEPDNENLINYVEGLIYWLTGHIEWYNYTKRYVTIEHSLKQVNVRQQPKMDVSKEVYKTKELQNGYEIEETESTPQPIPKQQETRNYNWISSIFFSILSFFSIDFTIIITHHKA